MPVTKTVEILALVTVIDTTDSDSPFYGNCQMARHVRYIGRDVCRDGVWRLMAKMDLTPTHQRLRKSDPHPQRRVYPYLLRKLVV